VYLCNEYSPNRIDHSVDKQDHPLPEKLKRILEQQPGKRTALIYQAVILALGIHIFFLSLLFFATSSPEGSTQAKSEHLLEEFDLQFEEEASLKEELLNPGLTPGELHDLVAGKSSERTTQMVSYSGRTKAQIEEEVNAQLYGLEKEEFERLKAERGGIQEPETGPEEKPVVNKTRDREDYDWFRNQSDKSHAGPVSAEFDLSGRSTRTTPRPTYRCRAAGKVVVHIDVDPSGNVLAAAINETASSADECIRAESLSYAKKWTFNYSPDSPKKQKGIITFTFRGQ